MDYRAPRFHGLRLSGEGNVIHLAHTVPAARASQAAKDAFKITPKSAVAAHNSFPTAEKVPRGMEEAPNIVQDGFKTAQEAPKTPQETSQRRLRKAQIGKHH